MYKSDNENDISKDNTTHSRDSGNGIKTEHILEVSSNMTLIFFN